MCGACWWGTERRSRRRDLRHVGAASCGVIPHIDGTHDGAVGQVDLGRKVGQSVKQRLLRYQTALRGTGVESVPGRTHAECGRIGCRLVPSVVIVGWRIVAGGGGVAGLCDCVTVRHGGSEVAGRTSPEPCGRRGSQ